MVKINGIELDDFTISYLQTALWSSPVYLPIEEDALVDSCMDVPEDHPLHEVSQDYCCDRYFGLTDFTEIALLNARDDCANFQRDNAGDLADECPERAGHDFWLTRNGHGAGFWDGDYDGPGVKLGRTLSDIAKGYGEQWVVLGDDNELHIY